MSTANNPVEALAKGGIDYAEAMDRFGGNDALYRRLAVKFLDDRHFEALEKALESGDAEQAFREAHSLKGIVGNLSFTDLYRISCHISDALRDGNIVAAQEIMAPLREARVSVVEVLEGFSA
ncbi:MAG: Hpt domain-containing protein [Gordonibacter sp.]|uniref:Hpt domain-containing protein n=1 Tax=Gordonibacter sp. TaxID=1968902 RepID=UPI002FC7AFB8